MSRLLFRPFCALACLLPGLASAAAYDADALFPARDGWQLLTRGARWELRLPTIPPAPAPVAEAGREAQVAAAPARVTAVPGGSDSADTSTTAETDGNPADSGAGNGTDEAITPGTVAVVGSGDGQAARRETGEDEATPASPPLALAGVRYRVLEAGDDTPPNDARQIDRNYVWLRATAKDLAGNPIGPEGRADDEDQNGVRRFDWNALPTALALAVEQMPYHARWEVFVPVSTRPAGKGGAYRILRSRALVFDVERHPPPEPVAKEAPDTGSMSESGTAPEDGAPATGGDLAAPVSAPAAPAEPAAEAAAPNAESSDAAK